MNNQKMEDLDLKKSMYVLYVLNTYDTDKILNIEELNFLKLMVFDQNDKTINSKEYLINKVVEKLDSKKMFQENKTIKFKVGDVIKTDFSSSLIELKFTFETIDNENFIKIFEHNKQISKILINKYSPNR